MPKPAHDPESAAPAPLLFPQDAGSYRRLPDGSLEQIEPPTAPPALPAQPKTTE